MRTRSPRIIYKQFFNFSHRLTLSFRHEYPKIEEANDSDRTIEQEGSLRGHEWLYDVKQLGVNRDAYVENSGSYSCSY